MIFIFNGNTSYDPSFEATYEQAYAFAQRSYAALQAYKAAYAVYRESQDEFGEIMPSPEVAKAE